MITGAELIIEHWECVERSITWKVKNHSVMSSTCPQVLKWYRSRSEKVYQWAGMKWNHMWASGHIVWLSLYKTHCIAFCWKTIKSAKSWNSASTYKRFYSLRHAITHSAAFINTPLVLVYSRCSSIYHSHWVKTLYSRDTQGQLRELISMVEWYLYMFYFTYLRGCNAAPG